MGRWLAALADRSGEKIQQTAKVRTDKIDEIDQKRILSILSVPVSSKCEIFIGDEINIEADLVRAQTLADQRNDDARRQGLTDRFCKCGSLAPRGWRQIGGREIWLCKRCEGQADG